MARQKGFGTFSGKIGDKIYYTAEGQDLVRSAPSIDAERVKTDPAFAAFNNNGSEFRAISSGPGKLFRDTLEPLVYNSRVNRLSARVNQLFSGLRKLDLSPVGQRTVGKCLQLPEGRALLEGFEFNDKALVRRLLPVNYHVDTGKGTLLLKNVSARSISWPKSATHVRFTCAMAWFDFDNGTGRAVFSDTEELARGSESQDVLLEAGGIEEENGVVLFVLKVWFVMKLENGQEFDVQNGTCNGAVVLGVG
jgi:hypothetical protein